MQNKQNTTSGFKKDEILISFIITFYNLPVSMLCECVESIIAIDLPENEREIIVIDDGSDYSPEELLKRYNNNIIYIKQDNGGLSSARNKGLSVCKGEYVQFVDADDKIISSNYSECIRILKRNPETGVLLFKLTSENARQPRGYIQKTKNGSEYLAKHNLRASACGYIFRRIEPGNLTFTTGILHEDEEFTPLLFSMATNIIEYDCECYFYRKRNESITHKSDKQHVHKRLNDIEGIITRLNSYAEAKGINHGIKRRVSQLCMDYIYNIMTLTGSYKELEKRISRLKEHGLFPIATTKYTWKYLIFSYLTRYKLCRVIMCHIFKS